MLLARHTTIALAVAGALAGCTTHAVASHDETERVWASTIVTEQELEGILRQGSLMEALERLRPAWLVSRRSTPFVTVDGAPPTELSFLRMIPTSTVREVRLERASATLGHSAFAANGNVVVGDLIVVTTGHGRGG